MTTDKQIPIANSSEHSATRHTQLFLMSAGAFNAGADVKCYVWADHLEDAFEVFVEWLDDNAPGLLVSHESFAETLQECAIAAGFASYEDACENDERAADHILEEAETDLTCIGHTTLTHGQYIASHEWFGHEASAEEIKEVKVRSVEEQIKADLPTLVDLLRDVYSDAEGCSEHDNPGSIDVRLQVSEDGTNWDLHTGDSSYDTDHRGYWGASCVVAEDGGNTDTALTEIALDLISQACDAMAESLS